VVVFGEPQQPQGQTRRVWAQTLREDIESANKLPFTNPSETVLARRAAAVSAPSTARRRNNARSGFEWL
jgi:hypothetical protein